MQPTMINAKNIIKYFDHTKVLKGVSLQVHKGEVVALIGPSGSGKSTLLRCLNHLESIDYGTIQIEEDILVSSNAGEPAIYTNEANIRQICRKMGMVFQHFNLFPHMTVLQNIIEAPIVVKGLKKEHILPKAKALLEKVGLLSKANNYPSQLSGGQKQRVAIVRALAMEPDIMLFDEPTSALDPELTGEVLKTIQQLAEEDMTMIIVTHEMAFAREVADTVYFMDQGCIIEGGKAAHFFATPTNERTRNFINTML